MMHYPATAAAAASYNHSTQCGKLCKCSLDKFLP